MDNASQPMSNMDVAAPAPIEDVASGIQPVAEFIPKDPPTLSHPTPPPEDSLAAPDAPHDIDMPDVSQPNPSVVMADASQPTPSDPPAAANPEINHGMMSAPLDTAADAGSCVAFNAPTNSDHNMLGSAADATPEQGVVRPRDEDGDDDNGGRAVKRSRVDIQPSPANVNGEGMHAKPNGQADSEEDNGPASEAEVMAHALAEPKVEAEESKERALPDDAKVVDVPTELASDVAPAVKTEGEEQPATQASEGGAQAAADTASAAPSSNESAQHPTPAYGTGPMTSLQRTVLTDKMKNLKKTKHSAPFLKPVDPVALNIPTYFDVIKRPMDLGTMDQKLKSCQYQTVQAFVDDFNLIIANCRKFNGDQHVITGSALNMQAYFNRMMEAIPGPDQTAPVKGSKNSTSASKTQTRRDRTSGARTDTQTFALQADGLPQIRRQSGVATERAKRAIKPPVNREISYAKPKRREHQLELRFCEHVLDQMKSPKLWQINGVFMQPVDPVALNIPHYFQVIKKPMDLSTVTHKLKGGEYGNAAEFKKDFDLMIDNCLTFNPQGNPVHEIGVQFRQRFEEMWKGKAKWEREHAPASARGGSVSDDDSDGDDDDDDDAPADDDATAKIKMLQEQLAQMQNMVAGLGGNAKGSKSKKGKAKGSKKKGGASASKSKGKSKKSGKAKEMSFEEKQEISEAVSRMTDSQQVELTRIITENCVRYRDMEDMELEIDDLPSNVQVKLLRYVRSLFGRPKNAAGTPPDDGAMDGDEDYLGERNGRGPVVQKRKKHKPMSKGEQEYQIQALQGKLAQFSKMSAGDAGLFSQTQPQDETSGDDESEESEEE